MIIESKDPVRNYSNNHIDNLMKNQNQTQQGVREHRRMELYKRVLRTSNQTPTSG